MVENGKSLLIQEVVGTPRPKGTMTPFQRTHLKYWDNSELPRLMDNIDKEIAYRRSHGWKRRDLKP